MILRRTEFLSTGIYGTWSTDKGALLYVTLEHSYPIIPDSTSSSTSFAPKVPCGTYDCIRRLSPRFGYDVFILKDVPGCDFIEIHKGNVEADSEGCILLGTFRSGNSILQSKEAFDNFMQLMTGIDSFSLTVS